MSLIDRMILEQKQIEAQGVLACRRLTVEIRRRAQSAIDGLRVPDLVGPLRLLHDMLRDAMLVSYLLGVKRSRKEAGILRLSVFDSTLASLQGLLDVNLDDIRARYDAETTNILEKTGLHMESQIGSTIQDIISGGEHVAEGKRLLNERFDKLGIAPKSPFALETLFRTQTGIAYGAGRWQADQDPAIQEILWGYEYVTAGDDRVREEHEALDGTKLPKDDPFWSRFWPPNGWNCRCQALPVFNEEAPDEPTSPPQTTEEGEVVQPDAGFGFNAGQLVSNAAVPISVPVVSPVVPLTAVPPVPLTVQATTLVKPKYADFIGKGPGAYAEALAKYNAAKAAQKAAAKTPTSGFPKPKKTTEPPATKTPTSGFPESKPPVLRQYAWENLVVENKKYQAAIESWTVDSYVGIRKAQAGLPTNKLSQARLKTFNQAVASAPPTRATVYRGMANLSKEQIEQMTTPGATLNFKTFNSSSVDVRVAQEFAQASRGHIPKNSILFSIETKTGIDIRLFNPDEAEIILRPGSYRVVAVNPSPTGGPIVKLEEL